MHANGSYDLVLEPNTLHAVQRFLAVFVRCPCCTSRREQPEVNINRCWCDIRINDTTGFHLLEHVAHERLGAYARTRAWKHNSHQDSTLTHHHHHCLPWAALARGTHRCCECRNCHLLLRLAGPIVHRLAQRLPALLRSAGLEEWPAVVIHRSHPRSCGQSQRHPLPHATTQLRGPPCCSFVVPRRRRNVALS